jgi:hypothetical protein
MLQEGLFVGDVCYFCGEGAPVGLRAGNPEMPKGYDYDGCNAGAVLDLMSVKDRRIALKSGMTYRLLVLPPDETMTPRLLRKLMKLVEDGATVVGQKPASSPSLQGYPACDDEVKALADRLWGDCDGVKVTERALGKGRIIWGKPLAEVLDAMGAKPDFEFADDTKRKKIVYIHRRVGETDVYFVSNQKNRDEEVECAFRVSGKVPELWHPETGRIEKAPVYAETDGRTTIPLRFDPAGSVFVVFREKANGADHAVAVKCSVARPPKPAHALEIRKAVYEATDGAGAKDVTDKLAALVKDGALLVEADNKTFGDPTPMHTKQLRVEYLLDGKAMVKTVKENGSLDIPEDVGAGAPTYELAVAGGMLELRAWCPGVYEITSASGKTVKVEVKAAQESLQVPGPWEVRFPPNWGAPERVTFDKLVSWSDRPEPGVKYFSGTATYVKKLNVPADLIGKDRRLHLDLGDVQVIADVQLNGKPLGILWTPPYRAEVTDLVKAGENDLEVKVVNLWPNRLIGDEQLPDDCEWTEGGAIKAWPQWLLEGKPRPGPRLTFTTWRHYTKDSPLLPSGLIGPVTLRVAEVRPVSLE